MSVRHVHARKGEYIAVHRSDSRPSRPSRSYVGGSLGDDSLMDIGGYIGLLWALFEVFSGKYGFFGGIIFLLYGPLLYTICGAAIGAVVEIFWAFFK